MLYHKTSTDRQVKPSASNSIASGARKKARVNKEDHQRGGINQGWKALGDFKSEVDIHLFYSKQN